MKKKTVFIIVIWLLVLCAAIWAIYSLATGLYRRSQEAEEPAASQEVIAVPAAEEGTGVDAVSEPSASVVLDPSKDYVIDYDAMFKSHDPDEVVMTVDGKDVTWNEYFYWIRYYAETIQYYMMVYNLYYGMDYKWTDPADEEGTMTLADSVCVDAKNHVSMMCIIENFADEIGFELSDEALQKLEDDLQADIVANCGEGATEEDFDAHLRETDYLTLETYKRYNRINYIYQNTLAWLYGESFEKVTDEEALKYLEDNGYMRANHILFMTIDPSTGAALDDDAIAEKLALAEKTVAELRKITNTDKLLKKFAELKTKYDEDTGKTAYPDGYVFTSGTMVQEFEDGWKALADYEISDPILTQYGYHVMIRLPHDPDAVIEYSDAGTALNARMKYGNDAYASLMQNRMDNAKIVLADSIIGFSVADYLITAPEDTGETSEAAGE